MSKRSLAAQRALIAICAKLSLERFQDESLLLWIDELRGLLPDCGHRSRPLEPVLATVQSLCTAPDGRARSCALSRLRLDLETYFHLSAARHLEDYLAEVSA